MQLWDWCIPREITLLAVHLASTNNEEADTLSRQMSTTHEWELDRPTCHHLFRTWDSPDIDLFATHTNKEWNSTLEELKTDALGILFSEDYAEKEHLKLANQKINLLQQEVNRSMNERKTLLQEANDFFIAANK
ncbi:hypothetical protein EYD10_08772, partial [Varanus komodoensis]